MCCAREPTDVLLDRHPKVSIHHSNHFSAHAHIFVIQYATAFCRFLDICCSVGEPIAGFIGQPFKNFDAQRRTAEPTVVWGVKGVGAFGYTCTDPFPKPGERRYIVCSNSHFNDAIKNYCEACKPDKVSMCMHLCVYDLGNLGTISRPRSSRPFTKIYRACWYDF